MEPTEVVHDDECIATHESLVDGVPLVPWDHWQSPPATPEEVRRWAGFDADDPHKPRTNGTLNCELCGRIVSARVHDV